MAGEGVTKVVKRCDQAKESGKLGKVKTSFIAARSQNMWSAWLSGDPYTKTRTMRV